MNTLDNQKGVVLVISLVMIMLLSIMAASMMYTIVNGKKNTANQLRAAQAMAYADAGLSEAMGRIAKGFTSGDTCVIEDLYGIGTVNPVFRYFIFKNQPGTPLPNAVLRRSLDTSSVSSYYAPTFTSLADTTDAVQIRYKTYDANGNGTIDDASEVYFYNYMTESVVLGRTPSDAMPVWQITSTGRVGTTRKVIVTDVVIPRLNIENDAAIQADGMIDVTGTVNICGHNHQASTPFTVDPPGCFGGNNHLSLPTGVHGTPTDYVNPTPNPDCLPAGCLPGGVTNSTISNAGGNKKFWGNPDSVENSPKIVKELWDDALLGEGDRNGLLTSGKYNWGTSTSPVNDFVHVTGANLAGNMEHQGVLWCEGDLAMHGQQKFRGLIYVDGNFTNSGTCTVVGAILVKGVTHNATLHGTITIMYSAEAVSRAIQQAMGSSLTIVSQREID